MTNEQPTTYVGIDVRNARKLVMLRTAVQKFATEVAG